ncbi:MAG: L-aspartate oxidase [Candidatus Sumerlaeales bacterium]|nr:L-aspartate oxidase [Candidatus Sumerlaeales bacterium]
MEKVDLLVIGCGIAGATAALIAGEAGLNVLIVTRNSNPAHSTATRWAQGGIIYKGEGDSPELLTSDIFSAGHSFGNLDAIWHLAVNGPKLVEQILIERLGVPFDTTGNLSDTLDTTEEGAHSVRRIIHCADATGGSIEQQLIAQLMKVPNVRFMTRSVAVELMTLERNSANIQDIYKPQTCIGAYFLHRDTGDVTSILAQKTILATGGLGQLYLHTTNPHAARGDGIAMAHRIGARTLNLEYIQFHPTAFYDSHGERFLISESVRGEGGELVTREGKPFMQNYHKLGSLAPRDVVARAIHQEMLNRKEPCVFLDISNKDPEFLRHRFPTIYRKCKNLGVDMTTGPIPVVPAAHYLCGGIAVDLEGRTNIKNLRAVGEVSCTGIHGANRLASTSLLEGLTWGYFAAKSIIKEFDEQAARNEAVTFPEIKPLAVEYEQTDTALVQQDWMTIKYTMWNYVGLIRSSKRLKRAQSLLQTLFAETSTFYERAKLTDDIIGLRNGCQTALLVMEAAMKNKQSCGCHFREN